METETRHGVETLDPEMDAYLAKVPEERRELILDNARTMEERWRWRGEDWPRPNPGEGPTKVAIVGFSDSRLLAPYGKEGWELWCLNDPTDKPGIPARHAFTRWFQIHPPRYLAKHYPRGLDDLARHWGHETGIRLYMDRHYPEYPDSEAYPREQVEALASHGWFHASSFDWMMGLAVLEGFSEIHVYGCDSLFAFPVMNREPLSGLQAMHYWIGVAEGRGARVHVQGGGHLFRILRLAVYESDLQYGWDREPALDLGTDVDERWRDVR